MVKCRNPRLSSSTYIYVLSFNSRGVLVRVAPAGDVLDDSHQTAAEAATHPIRVNSRGVLVRVAPAGDVFDDDHQTAARAATHPTDVG